MAAGTITLTNGSDAVTGTGTTFTTDLFAGDFVVAAVGGITYTLPVKSVVSDTALTLISKYSGPTQANLAWNVVPRATQNQVTAELVAQVTQALRGQNYDKANWQAVFSASGDITVLLPDGSTFTGPSWKKIADILVAIDPVEMQALAAQVGQDAQQVAADRNDVDVKAAQTAIDAHTANTAAETATTANTAAQQAKTDAVAAKVAAEQAAASVPSMSNVDLHLQQAGVSAAILVTDLNSVISTAASVVNFRYAAGSTNTPDSLGGTGRQITDGTVITQSATTTTGNTFFRSKSGSAAWSTWVKLAFNANDATDTAWIPCTMQSSWAVVSGSRAVYRKVLGGIQLMLNVTPGNTADGTTITTLPVGFRPKLAFGVTVNAPPAASGVGVALPRLAINDDGTLVIRNCNGGFYLFLSFALE